MYVPTLRCGAAALDQARFLDNVAKVAGGLDRLGVGAGDRVALLLKNSLDFVEISLAVGKLGAFSVPLNWHFTAAEIDVLLEDCTPKLIFLHETLRDQMPLLWFDRSRVIVVGEELATSEYSNWREENPAYRGPDRPHGHSYYRPIRRYDVY